MMNNLFVYPKEIPKYIPKVFMYRTTKYQTLSRRDKDAQEDLDSRVNHYSKLFEIEGTPVDSGDRIIIQNDEYELEIYLFYKLIKLGYKVKEAPVTKIYPPKELGYTKMKPIIGWWNMLKPIFFLGLGIKK